MDTQVKTRPREILMVDDNLSDVRLTEAVLKRIDARHNLSVVENGEQAMAFLRRDGKRYEQAPRPDLILLDLNMSQKGGLETLAAIKAHSHLRMIPVVVFTTSDHERNIFNAYAHYANTYVVKPANEQDFVRAVHIIAEYWFHTATHFLR